MRSVIKAPANETPKPTYVRTVRISWWISSAGGFALNKMAKFVKCDDWHVAVFPLSFLETRTIPPLTHPNSNRKISKMSWHFFFISLKHIGVFKTTWALSVWSVIFYCFFLSPICGLNHLRLGNLGTYNKDTRKSCWSDRRTFFRGLALLDSWVLDSS